MTKLTAYRSDLHYLLCWALGARREAEGRGTGEALLAWTTGHVGLVRCARPVDLWPPGSPATEMHLSGDL